MKGRSKAITFQTLPSPVDWNVCNFYLFRFSRYKFKFIKRLAARLLPRLLPCSAEATRKDRASAADGWVLSRPWCSEANDATSQLYRERIL